MILYYTIKANSIHIKLLLLLYFYIFSSGWHVEKGDIYDTKLTPLAIISLTLPKECMRGFKGVHYVGGR